MIAKLAVWGEDRAAAIKRLSAKLGQYRVAGVTTNRDFLLRVARNADFGAGAVDTGFIARHREALRRAARAGRRAVAAASHALMRGRAASAVAPIAIRRGRGATAGGSTAHVTRDDSLEAATPRMS